MNEDNRYRLRREGLARDMGNLSANNRTAPINQASPMEAAVDDLWAQYQATAPKPRPKKDPVKTQPVASGEKPVSAAPRQGGTGAPQPTAAAAPPPRPELAPGLPVPRDLAEAESYAAQMAGSIDPRVQATDQRTRAMTEALKEHIRQRRAAGEKLSWEP